MNDKSVYYLSCTDLQAVGLSVYHEFLAASPSARGTRVTADGLEVVIADHGRLHEGRPHMKVKADHPTLMP